MQKILTVDIGTSKLCAGIFNFNTGQFDALTSCANDSNVSNLPAEHKEQNAEHIISAIFNLIKNIRDNYPNELKSVAGISISGQMHGVVVVNDNGTPTTNLITWQDKRTLEINPLLSEINNEDNFRITGTHLHCGYGGATLAWLSANGMISNNNKALSIADYLAFRLTGRICTEKTDAASWGLLDLQKNDWHYPLIKKLGINKNVLPPLNRSASPLGEIKPDIADELGLKRKTTVYSPIGDNQASVIGVVGFNSNKLIINLGTGGQISIPQNDYNVIDGFETRPMPAGGSILVGASLCGGRAYAYLCDFVKNLIKQVADIELPTNEVYKKLDELADNADTSCGRLKVDTRFAGTRENNNLRGSIYNIDTDNLNIGNLARGFMAGMVEELAQLANKTDISEMTKVAACGNSIKKNPLMPQIISDIFQKDVELADVHEEAAVGAALAVAYNMKIAKK